MKASDLIVELQRFVDEHGDVEVFRVFEGRLVDARHVLVEEMCVDEDGYWRTCDREDCQSRVAEDRLGLVIK